MRKQIELSLLLRLVSLIAPLVPGETHANPPGMRRLRKHLGGYRGHRTIPVQVGDQARRGAGQYVATRAQYQPPAKAGVIPQAAGRSANAD